MVLKASTQERLESTGRGDPRFRGGTRGDSVGLLEHKVTGSQALKTQRSSVD